MPRLFTALEVPVDVGERLSLLRGGLPGARWIDSAFYHVTLRFIGDIDFRMADEVAEALSRVRRHELSLRLDGLTAFGSAKPHSIVARIAPSSALGALQAEHERIMQRIGLPPDGRRFQPHVTLARLRGAGARDVASYLTLRGGFAAPPFTASRFVLYSSRDSVGGGPYLVEQSYPLEEAA